MYWNTAPFSKTPGQCSLKHLSFKHWGFQLKSYARHQQHPYIHLRILPARPQKYASTRYRFHIDDSYLQTASCTPARLMFWNKILRGVPPHPVLTWVRIISTPVTAEFQPRDFPLSSPPAPTLSDVLIEFIYANFLRLLSSHKYSLLIWQKSGVYLS